MVPLNMPNLHMPNLGTLGLQRSVISEGKTSFHSLHELKNTVKIFSKEIKSSRSFCVAQNFEF